MIKFDKVGDILAKIGERVEFVVIGDTVVDVALGRKGTESDVDLFVNGLLLDEGPIIVLSEENGWELGRTPIDTPRLIVDVEEQQLQVDFYDNLQDFFVPPKVLESAEVVRLGKREFKGVRIEDYFLLKLNAFREEDEEELKSLLIYVADGKIKLDRGYLSSHVELFEENSKSIRERLSGLGLRV
ncbi:nucleotidyltransferase [Sulfodiicoccus acidiphilus]|uniref:Nucleotidyltransferase n=1 Tax=Sulfodiicoccus acidiphilus TaxID=1670455 RepID=A0A348B2R4_9CREN|nr:nucleotidyltransferase [Sulfodiicoccus acidiphilus]BBD72466.1 nucleotidyltransferase [Sulfodiicoccus acidiphilus]GGT96928.1 nucleotidyltransferase [Sulfodiicoccus acidiphilus]